MIKSYTPLEIEHFAWDVIRNNDRVRGRIPIDVEYLLECSGAVLRVIAGLVPKWSVGYLICRNESINRIEVIVDQTLADSPSNSGYRFAIGEALGILTLHSAILDQIDSFDEFNSFLNSQERTLIYRESKMFAVALMAPEPLIVRESMRLADEVDLNLNSGDLNSIRQRLSLQMAAKFELPTQIVSRRLADVWKFVSNDVGKGEATVSQAPLSEPSEQHRQLLFSSMR